MVEGAFSFLLFLFASPQQIVINQLHGHWLVTTDNTEQVREWNRIYYFEKCSKKDRIGDSCQGHYGWAEFDEVYLNLYDKNYLEYGVVKLKESSSGERKIYLSGVYYDFVLNTKKKTLKLYDPEDSDLVLEMRKVTRSELKSGG